VPKLKTTFFVPKIARSSFTAQARLSLISFATISIFSASLSYLILALSSKRSMKLGKNFGRRFSLGDGLRANLGGI